MNDHDLTAENFLAVFPVALQGDQSSAALAKVTARLLARRPAEIDRIRIYPDIDRLDEKLLDTLAYDYKVDWWDPDYGLTEKRRTLKGSWRVHKKLGTRFAVRTALQAVFPKSDAEPWFLYEGKPYHFRLNIDLTEEKYSANKPGRAMELVRFYQSLRDRMDVIQYTMVLPPAQLRVGGGIGIQSAVGIPQGEDRFDFRDTLHTGGGFGGDETLGTPQGEDQYRFQDTVRTGGTGGIHDSAGVPEGAAKMAAQTKLSIGGNLSVQERFPPRADRSPPPAITILRTGGVCTIRSNLSKGE